MMALIPAQEGATVQIDKKDKLPVFLLQKSMDLSPGDYQQLSVDIYAGPKERKVLAAIGKNLENSHNFRHSQ